MEPEITHEQKNQLKAWSKMRDEILGEISSLETLKSGFQTYLNNTSNSAKEIEDRKKVIEGNIEELIKKEEELPGLIKRDLAKLENQKTMLESKKTLLEVEIKDLERRKEALKSDLSSELTTFEVVKGSTLSLEKIVGHVIDVSSKNENTINLLMESLKKDIGEILENSSKIVKDSNEVIKELPKMVVEARKQVVEKAVIKKAE